VSEYLTLRQFAAARGHSVTPTAMKRLRRRLTKKQRKLGQAFLIQTSEAPNAPLLTTEALMRQYCPEFFDRRSEARVLLDTWTEEFREELATFKQITNGLGSRFRAVKTEVQQLAQRVESLAASPKPGPNGTPSPQG
jgi:hypothetical protein